MNHHLLDGGGPDKHLLDNLAINLAFWLEFILGENDVSHFQIFSQDRACGGANGCSGGETRAKDLTCISRYTN
ncbi:MAG: hypothetical protein NTV55_02575 [Planctomycetota bacterium]|nr:hypothetical protein [Planctomycetota bacterium]